MLRFETANVTPAKIGSTHGLDLDTLLKERGTALEAAMRWLFDESQEPGGWKRWVDLGQNTELATELKAYAESIKGEFDDIVILGIGGSSLGGLALLQALLHPKWNLLSKEQRGGLPRYHFVDNVDADCVAGLFDVLEPKRTLVNVISKSGTTAESMAAFLYAKAWLEQTIASDAVYQKHLVFTTDREKGVLRPIAIEKGVQCFEVPDDVGGRFSIFSAVGLLPAALCGLDPAEFQRGITDIYKQLRDTPIQENPAALGALIQVAYMEREKPISVLMPYSTRLAAVADWYVQLWAESLGKAKNKQGQTVNIGPTPLKAVGATDQHSQVQLYNEGPFDKVFTFVQVENADRDIKIPDAMPGIDALEYLANQPFHKLLTAEFEATRATLTKSQRPNVTWVLPKVDTHHFAQLLYVLMIQTGLAGYLMNIDPFDQPGVEQGKIFTYALMGRKGYDHLVAEAKGESPSAV